MEIKTQSWKEYFETHPEFANMERPKLWSPDSRGGRTTMRFYFGEAGYLQRVVTEQARNGSSYYDQHRMSKGDTHEVINDEIAWSGDEGLRDRLLSISESKDVRDLWQKLVALNSRKRSRKGSR